MSIAKIGLILSYVSVAAGLAAVLLGFMLSGLSYGKEGYFTFVLPGQAGIPTTLPNGFAYVVSSLLAAKGFIEAEKRSKRSTYFILLGLVAMNFSLPIAFVTNGGVLLCGSILILRNLIQRNK